MARISFDSLNYSRDAGMFTVSGKDYLAVADKLRSVEGLEVVEHDADNSEIVFTYSKIIIDQDRVKQLFKQAKFK